MFVKSALWAFALGFLAAGLAIRPVIAATPTSSFGVTATVQSDCQVSVNAMAFGTYTATVVNATTAVSVTCTNTTPYNVGLSAGLAPGATVTTRKMTGPGSAMLSYALVSSLQGGASWGQTVGTDTMAGTGNGSAQSLTMYGQISAGQYVAPGAYTDTITVTVTY
jgi:spore coat protein U-like protein